MDGINQKCARLMCEHIHKIVDDGIIAEDLRTGRMGILKTQAEKEYIWYSDAHRMVVIDTKTEKIVRDQ